MPLSVAARLGGASFLFLLAVGTAGGAAAEVKKLMNACPGQKLCAWYQSTVTPPKGWVEDKDAGAQNRLTILLPEKENLDFNDPMIYVQTSYRPGPDTLETIVAADQAQWRRQEARVAITPIGTAPRASGAPPFELFLYQNPDTPKQAFEAIAFGLTTTPNGERYFLTVVDTAASKAAIDRSRDDFLTVLKGL